MLLGPGDAQDGLKGGKYREQVGHGAKGEHSRRAK